MVLLGITAIVMMKMRLAQVRFYRYLICYFSKNMKSYNLARDAQEKLRSSLARYLHYYNRYMNHMQSLKFEHKLYASVKAKMEEMQQHNMSWIEV